MDDLRHLLRDAVALTGPQAQPRAGEVALERDDANAWLASTVLAELRASRAEQRPAPRPRPRPPRAALARAAS